MRRHVICWLALLGMVGTAAWSAGTTTTQVKLRINGAPSTTLALLVGKAPLLPVTALPTTAAVKAQQDATGQWRLSRPQAIVRVTPGAAQMSVDGQRVPLPTPPVLYQKALYLPAEAVKALLPDYTTALTYDSAIRTVLFAAKPKAAAKSNTEAQLQTAAVNAACAPTGGAQGVPTQEFGPKKGAKVEIVAALPITHGCHVRTEAALKQAQQAHPKDVHLTIYDLFGPDGQKFVATHGGQRAVVFINDQTTFDLNGKKVRLEYTEGRYNPSDIVPIVDNLVKGS